MKRFHVIAIIALFHISLAAAQPAKRAACLDVIDGASLSPAGTDVIACNGSTEDPKCLSITPGRGAREVDPPTTSSFSLPAEVKPAGDRFELCAATKCRKLGKRASAALRAQRTDDSMHEHATPVVATTDLAALVIGTDVWNVTGDRRIKLAPPPRKRGEAARTLVGIEVLDELLVPQWSGCAGPCTTSVVVTSAGATRGNAFPGGTPMALDDDRFVIVPREAAARLTLLARHTGKLLGTLDLGLDAIETSLPATSTGGGEALLALLPTDTGSALTVLRFPRTGKPSRGDVLATIPRCR